MNLSELTGYVAAFCTTFAFLPQALKTWRSRSAKDLSLPMFLMFTIGVTLWLVYGLIIQNGPMIASNTVTVLLAGSILFFKLKYG